MTLNKNQDISDTLPQTTKLYSPKSTALSGTEVI